MRQESKAEWQAVKVWQRLTIIKEEWLMSHHKCADY